LTAVISHVYDPSKNAVHHSHLVAQIKVDPKYYMETNVEANTTWHLFNDFHVTPCSVEEVTDFSFKSPCVLYYTRVDIDRIIPVLPRINPITEDVFFTENPIKQRLHTYQPLSFIPLSRQSLPRAGDILSIDAEFVSLGAEETEIRADGARVVINPCHFSLARVSVLRAQHNQMVGEPFMDDYIVTSEPVIDYLTRFSGIVPGDLDPKLSKHHVTTLKAVYLKLRYLVDKGCCFLGHGLAKDFRIFNILVPPQQVIDTVELFHLDGQRKISLRFLASCLLNLDIQTETHCSIEDARTALILFNKYLELQQEKKI